MLTDTLIRKARTPDKPTKLMDGRGLFMLLTPFGGRWRRFTCSACRVPGN